MHVQGFLSGISTDLDARRITIQDCVFTRVGEGDGSAGWPSDFGIKSSLVRAHARGRADGQTLLLRCRSISPPSYKGFGFVTQAKHCGPNAVVAFHGPHARIAPHQRWSTGLLVDVSEAQGCVQCCRCLSDAADCSS